MDTGSLILIGIIVVAVVLLMQRLMRQQQNPYSQPGNNRPQYDDPNVSSHGAFGGNHPNTIGGNRPQYDDPNIESHGGFGRNNNSVNMPSVSHRKEFPTASSQSQAAVTQKAPERNRDNDDPNVSSHGGFGGSR